MIKKQIPGAIIVLVDKTTNGQATTCMLAAPYIDDDEPVYIGSCDVGCFYNKDKFAQACNDNDAVVLTCTQQEVFRRNPDQYGWCVLKDDGVTIADMSVKKPVSADPYYDHIVTGSFFFRRFSDFKAAYDLMVKNKYLVNGELYVDSIPVFMKQLGKKTAIFDIDLYPNWGTPADLEDYKLIERVCLDGEDPSILSHENKRLLPLWIKYIQSKL